MSNSWPAWFYGPAGAAAIFATAGAVPAGWADHPSKVAETAKPAKAAPTPTPAPAPAQQPATSTGTQGTAAPEIDAHGHPWSADLHAATRNITKDGLWRMKVGVKRPDPLPGYPKTFDL